MKNKSRVVGWVLTALVFLLLVGPSAMSTFLDWEGKEAAFAKAGFTVELEQSPVGSPVVRQKRIDPAMLEAVHHTAATDGKPHPGVVGVASLTLVSQSNKPRPLPYPQSEVLAGLEWTSEPHLYPGIQSDMHWHAWGEDDTLYSVDGDGQFWGTGDYFCSLSKISGAPPTHRIELVTQFKDLDLRAHAPDGMQRYLCGPLAVGSDLYVCVYDYDWRITGKDVSKRQEMLAVDRYSKHGGIPAILHSRDGGNSWSNAPRKDTPRFLGPDFGNLQFVGFGPGYTRVPKELGDFVYAISNDSNWESGDHLFLARVPKDKVLDRSAWEFFSGASSAPAWSSAEGAAKPVFRDPRHVGHSDMTYNRGLNRYILSVFSDSVPHLETATVADTKSWEKQTELQVYEGTTPWGPWALVYREAPWGGADHACYLPHVPAKWLSDDGLTGWMLYSGDWEHEHYPQREFYGYMVREFRLRPSSSAIAP
ncbi:MAG: DUF4185 domain-containing protein [Lacipirellulaceae bacterium]